MTEPIPTLFAILYAAAAAGLFLYGLNCYVMISLYRRERGAAGKKVRDLGRLYKDLLLRPDLPNVTTQITVYNEMNVIERILRAVSRIDYPPEKHQIQVLDDSSDETRGLIDRIVLELREGGHNVEIVRRRDRVGFKAGALAEGLQTARGELIAVFDADFVPPPDFLVRTVPFFMADSGIGLVQARWGHLNRDRSLLTRAQSIGIDGHFMVEQAARNWNGLYMNFNGTAGLWRRAAILDGGGWQWDTLTEDMDLSYRVQLAGWGTMFLSDLIVPAEIPEDVSAFKSQQFRWAKGSIQTAVKLLPRIFSAPATPFKKVQALFHLTHYLVHPLMLGLAVLALPVLITVEMSFPPALFSLIAGLLLLSMLAPSSLYLLSQRAAYPDWRRRILFLPALVVLGVGIAVSNTRAVAEALLGRKSGFVRTPKRGDREIKRYRVRFPGAAILEIVLGIYCAGSLGYYLAAGKYLVGPFLGIYAAGFLFVGLLSVAHAMGLSR